MPRHRLLRSPAWIIGLVISLLMALHPGPALACVDGLAWGMPRAQVSAQISSDLILDEHADLPGRQRLIARNAQLDQLPARRLTLDIDREQGLQSLAYSASMT